MVIDMEDIVSQTHRLLIENKKTVAVAESCTGGLVSNLLTRAPGSSRYFMFGAVVYSNSAKRAILKIPAQLIAKKGSVSQETAKAMAESVRRMAKADFGIGLTGIAGPGGETPEKPVGTVFIAVDSRNNKTCKEFHFTGGRPKVRKKAALKSLELLRAMLR